MEEDNTAAQATGKNGLEILLPRLQEGPWRFIQLRGSAISADNVDVGDVDFLGTRESVASLLRAAYGWVQSGQCHLQVRARSRNKVSLTLISLDGLHTLRLDLWIRLHQMRNRNLCLQFENCEHLLDSLGASIQRLPVQVQACIYLHHLAAKKKRLASMQVQQRLHAYTNACNANPALASIIGNIALTQRIDAEALDFAEQYLREARVLSTVTLGARAKQKLTEEVAAAWLDGPRPVHHVAIAGCDGSGKSTLIRTLIADANDYRMLKGKRLYRSSLLYKLAVLFVRPLLPQHRDKFDDTFAFFVYARAAIALRLRLWFHSDEPVLIDRSLIDFLIVDRKTDEPRLHLASWIAKFSGRRIPTVHLVLPYEKLRTRKTEVSRAGQAKYDELMFNCLSRRTPTDYVMFYNGGDEAFSRAALSNILRRMVKG